MATYKLYKKTSATAKEEVQIPASSVSGLAKVATSGSYNDLSNTPTIPDTSGLMPKSGGTFTGDVTMASGHHLKTDLIKSADDSKWIAEITPNGLEIGGSGTPLRLYSSTRPVHANANKELAYTSDIPTDYVPTTGGAVTGNLTVGGNLTINGTTTTVDSTTLQVKDKLIEVAHGNTTALTTPAGLVAPKYDGTNSGALVFDSTGTAYVGDVTLKDGNIDVANSGGLQPIATRTGLVGGNLVQYDSTELTLKDSGKKISDLALKTDVSGKLSKTENTGVNVLGTTKSTTTLGGNQLVAPNGIIFAGTAANAGLVTRGICGVTTPDSNGACSKENLYLNYDGNNDFNAGRQVVLNAGSVGNHLGSNMYQYAVPRGDIVKAWVESKGYATTSQVEARYKKPSNGIPKTDLESAVQTSLGKADNALSLDGGTIKKSKTIKMDASANSDGANLKWGTVNSKNPYIGYASDQVDGTFVVGSLLGTNYASGLAIGGGSGNLLWKGAKVATTNDIPPKITESTVSGWGFTKNEGTVTSVSIKMNGVVKGTVTSSGTIDLGTSGGALNWVQPSSFEELSSSNPTTLFMLRGAVVDHYAVTGIGNVGGYYASYATLSCSDYDDEDVNGCVSAYISFNKSNATIHIYGVLINTYNNQTVIVNATGNLRLDEILILK